MSNDWLTLFSDQIQDKKEASQVSSFLPMTQFIEGEYIAEHRIFYREKRYLCKDIGIPFDQHVIHNDLCKYSRLFFERKLNPENILFIDTETTGLSRSQGTFVFMLGIGQIKGEEFILSQYFVEEMADEVKLYSLLCERFKQAEMFVSYNGKSFDIPLLQSRLVLQKQDINIRLKAHLDLLPIARRFWKSKVECFSLSRMEYHLFEKLRSDEFDVPGYLIPSLYADYQQSGNPEPLVSVFIHNEEDIVSLYSIYSIVIQAFSNDEYVFQSEQFNLLEIGRLYEQIGEFERALIYYQKSNEEDSSVSLLYLARLYKKLKREKDAERCWLSILSEESYIELSKLYEKQKKYHLSLHYAQKSQLLLEEINMLTPKKEEKIQQRIERIERKLNLSSNKSI